MRLDPAEVAELPLAAALLDRSRHVVAATPEWSGPAPGMVTYHAGHGHLAVGGERRGDPDRISVLARLLDELDLTAAALGGEDRLRATLLAAGLRLVSGEPLDESRAGTGRDVLQMDPALSYGLVEYLRTLEALGELGWSPRRMIPHGGHQMALSIAAGLGLGGNESYPGVFEPFGGFADDTPVVDGRVGLPDAPGVGFEQKARLWELLRDLV